MLASKIAGNRGVDVLSYQLKLIKMRAELANLNVCAVPFLSRAAVNFCWYYYILN